MGLTCQSKPAAGVIALALPRKAAHPEKLAAAGVGADGGD